MFLVRGAGKRGQLTEHQQELVYFKENDRYLERQVHKHIGGQSEKPQANNPACDLEADTQVQRGSVACLRLCKHVICPTLHSVWCTGEPHGGAGAR